MAGSPLSGVTCKASGVTVYAPRRTNLVCVLLVFYTLYAQPRRWRARIEQIQLVRCAPPNALHVCESSLNDLLARLLAVQQTRAERW